MARDHYIELVIAALIAPGHADNSVTIPLGYGRNMPGFDALPYAGAAVEDTERRGDQVGFNAYFLRTAFNPHFIVADGKNVESVKVEKGARNLRTPDHPGALEHRRPRPCA